MPDETRAPVSAPRPGWRANVRLLATVIARSGRRAAPETSPPAGYVNPLRARNEQSSLFGEILDWMLAPLLLLWPLSVTITYVVAQGIAHAPFDRQLADGADLLADHLRDHGGQVTLQLPLSARTLLRADSADAMYYMVLGLRGELAAGERDLPLPPEDERPTPGTTRLRTETMRGTEVRIAYTWVAFSGRPGSQPALVQVAETLERREKLANEMMRGVIVPQFITLPIAVALVWFGLTRGLAPLNFLQARIRARRPDDLSPIERGDTPEEMAPLVDAFNDLLERLAQNMNAQRRFIADAAHQMKTPLAGLRTQAELALRETDPRELRRSLQQIAGSTERATHLINQLLALARAEHQATDVAGFEAVDLDLLARDLVRDHVPQALARGIDLGFESTPGTARVIGMPVLLRELLNNLVENALRYTPRGGAVTVRVRAEAEAVFLDVEDTGPGIAEAERHLVFDRFYRVLGSNVDGSGLGLAIVREIVEQHDALVRLGNNPRATEQHLPGTLISVEFVHLLGAAPTLNLG